MAKAQIGTIVTGGLIPRGTRDETETASDVSGRRQLPKVSFNDPAYARAALAAGATGYVVKTVSEEDLVAAIRSVRRGKAVVDLDDEARTAKVFGPSALQAVRGPMPATVGLSPREREVLSLLGHGHTNTEVAEKLDISPKTVATYRARIGEKLGLKTTADFVRFATDTGLLGAEESPSSNPAR